MAAIIATEGLGLFNSSKQALGSAGMGFGGAGDQLHVNAVNGNLVIQRQDQVIKGHGVDASLVRTYNSQGALSDSVGGQYFNYQQRIVDATTVNNAPKTRITADGFEQRFSEVSANHYVSEEGAGAHDTLVYANGVWTYTEGSSGVVETYDAANNGRLLTRANREGLGQSFFYQSGGLLEYIVDGAKQVTRLRYDDSAHPNAVTQLESYRVASTADLSTPLVDTYASLIAYEYDSVGRLAAVIADLTPYVQESDAVDALKHTYTTRYTYDGPESIRIASIHQGEGSDVANANALYFEYEDSGDYRITQLRMGEGSEARVTDFTYYAQQTDVTNYLEYRYEGGQYQPRQTATTRYNMDEQGQLTHIEAPADEFGRRQTTTYTYTDRGDVRQVRDGNNHSVRYFYDYDDAGATSNDGLRLWQMDNAGNATRWVYHPNHQVAAEIQYQGGDVNPLDEDFAPSQAEVSRFIYDDAGRLRFSVGAQDSDGQSRVSETRYGDLDSNDQRIMTGYTYRTLFSVPSGWAITDNQLTVADNTWDINTLSAWANDSAQQNAASITETYLDFRGQVSQIRRTVEQVAIDHNASNDSVGPETLIQYFFYDEFGRLIQQLDGRTDTDAAPSEDSSNRASHAVGYTSGGQTLFAYDGLGRLIASAVATDSAAEQVALNSLSLSNSALGGTDLLIDENRLTRNTGGSRFNQVTHYGVNAAGQQQVITLQGNGLTAISTYSSAGELLSVSRYDSASTSIAPIDGQAPEDIIFGDTQYHYDDAGRLRMMTDAEGVRTHSLYNPSGQLVATVDGSGALTEMSYDDSGSLVRTLQYGNYLNVTQLNRLATVQEGELVVLTPSLSSIRPSFGPDDRIVHSLYDEANRLAYNIDGEGYVTEYQYDGVGRLTNTIAHSTPYLGYDYVTTEGLAISAPDYDALKAFSQYNYTAVGDTLLTGAWEQGSRQISDATTLSHQIDGSAISAANLASLAINSAYDALYIDHGITLETVLADTSAVDSWIERPYKKMVGEVTWQADFSSAGQLPASYGFTGVDALTVGRSSNTETQPYFLVSDGTLALTPKNVVYSKDISWWNTTDQMQFSGARQYDSNARFELSYTFSETEGGNDGNKDILLGLGDENNQVIGFSLEGDTIKLGSEAGSGEFHSFPITRVLGTSYRLEMIREYGILVASVYEVTGETESLLASHSVGAVEQPSWGDGLHSVIELWGKTSSGILVHDIQEIGVAFEMPYDVKIDVDNTGSVPPVYGQLHHEITDFSDAGTENNWGFIAEGESNSLGEPGYTVGEGQGSSAAMYSHHEGVLQIKSVDSNSPGEAVRLMSNQTYRRNAALPLTFRWEFTGGFNSTYSRAFFGFRDENNNAGGVKLVRDDAYSSNGVKGSDFGVLPSNRDIDAKQVVELVLVGNRSYVYYYPAGSTERQLFDTYNLSDNTRYITPFIEVWGEDNTNYNKPPIEVTSFEVIGLTEWIPEHAVVDDTSTQQLAGRSLRNAYSLNPADTQTYLDISLVETLEARVVRSDLINGSAIPGDWVETYIDPANYSGQLVIAEGDSLAAGEYQIETRMTYHGSATPMVSQLLQEDGSVVRYIEQYSMQENVYGQGAALQGYFTTQDNSDPRYLDLSRYSRIDAQVKNIDTGDVTVTTTTIDNPEYYSGYVLLNQEQALTDGLYEITLIKHDPSDSDSTGDLHETFMYQVGTPQDYGHTIALSADDMHHLQDGSTPTLTYWKLDSGRIHSTSDQTVVTQAMDWDSASNQYQLTVSDLVAGQYGYQIQYAQAGADGVAGTVTMATLQGEFRGDSVDTTAAQLTSQHQYIDYLTEETSEGLHLKDYLTTATLLDGSAINFDKNTIQQLHATVRYVDSTQMVTQAVTDIVAWGLSAGENSVAAYSDQLMLTQGNALTAGQYTVDVVAHLADGSIHELSSTDIGVYNRLSTDVGAISDTNTARLMWDDNNAEVTTFRYQEEGSDEYTTITIHNVDGDSAPEATLTRYQEANNAGWVTREIGPTITGGLSGVDRLAVEGLSSTVLEIDAFEPYLNTGIQRGATEPVYTSIAFNGSVDTGMLDVGGEMLAGTKLTFPSLTYHEDFLDVNSTFDGVGSSYVDLSGEGALLLGGNDGSWYSITDTEPMRVGSDSSGSEAVVEFTFNTGRLQYEGFIGVEARNASSEGDVLGLMVHQGGTLSIVQGRLESPSFDELLNGIHFSENQEYTVRIVSTPINGAVIEVIQGEDTLLTYNHPISSYISSQNDLARWDHVKSRVGIKTLDDSFNGGLRLTSISKTGNHKLSTVDDRLKDKYAMQYREVGGDSWRQYPGLGVHENSGLNFYWLDSDELLIPNTEYEFELISQDIMYTEDDIDINHEETRGYGRFTTEAGTNKLLEFTLKQLTGEVSTVEGMSFKPILSAAAKENIDGFFVEVFEKRDESSFNRDYFIGSALTRNISLPEHNGYANLPSGLNYDSGKYDLKVTYISKTGFKMFSHYDNVSISELYPEATQKLAFTLPSKSADTSIGLLARPVGSDEPYQEFDVTEQNGVYQTQLRGAINAEWEYVITEKSADVLIAGIKGALTIGKATGITLDVYEPDVRDFEIDPDEIIDTETNIYTITIRLEKDGVETFVETDVGRTFGFDGSAYISNDLDLEPGTYLVTGRKTSDLFNDSDVRFGPEGVKSFYYQVGDIQQEVVTVSATEIDDTYSFNFSPNADGQDIIVELSKSIDRNSVTLSNLNDSRYAYGIEYSDAAGDLFGQLDGSFVASHLQAPTIDDVERFYGFNKPLEIATFSGVQQIPADENERLGYVQGVSYIAETVLSDVNVVVAVDDFRLSPNVRITTGVLGEETPTWYVTIPLELEEVFPNFASEWPKTKGRDLPYENNITDGAKEFVTVDVTAGNLYDISFKDQVDYFFNYYGNDTDERDLIGTFSPQSNGSVDDITDVALLGDISTIWFEPLLHMLLRIDAESEQKDNILAYHGEKYRNKRYEISAAEFATTKVSGGSSSLTWVYDFTLRRENLKFLSFNTGDWINLDILPSDVPAGKSLHQVEYTDTNGLTQVVSAQEVPAKDAVIVEGVEREPAVAQRSRFVLSGLESKEGTDIQYRLILRDNETNELSSSEWQIVTGGIGSDPITTIVEANVTKYNLSNTSGQAVVALPDNLLTDTTNYQTVTVELFGADDLDTPIRPAVTTEVGDVIDWSDHGYKVDIGELLEAGFYTVKYTVLDKDGIILQQTDHTPLAVGNVTHPLQVSTLTWSAESVPDNAEVYARFTSQGNTLANESWELANATINNNGDYQIDFGSGMASGTYDFELLYVDTVSHKELSSATGSFVVDYTQESVQSTGVQFSRSVTGREARSLYAVNGDLQATISPDGAVTEFVYDGKGLLVHTIAYGRAIADSTLQLTGSLTEVLVYARDTAADPEVLESLHSYQFYNQAGQAIARVDAGGYLSISETDDFGRVVATKRFANAIDPASVDNFYANLQSNHGIGVSIADLMAHLGNDAALPADQTSQTAYNDAGWVTHSIDTQGVRTNIDYNAVGQRIAITSGLNEDGSADSGDASRSTTQTRNASGLVREETTGDQRLTHHYDNNGLLIRTITHSNESGLSERETRFFYDANGRLVFSLNANNELEEIRYNAFGDAIGTQTYADRLHDERIDLSGIQGGIASAALLQYFRGFRSDSDSRNHLRYDRRGQLRAQINANGDRMDYEYTAFGEKARDIRTARGGVQDGKSIVTEYVRDNAGRIISTAADAFGLRQTQSVQYDTFGRVVISQDASGHRASFDYDALGRQVVVHQQLNGQLHTLSSTTYDAFGRMLETTDADNTRTRFVYHESDRSVVITTGITDTSSGVSETTWTNRHGETRLVQNSKGEQTRYEYDLQGQLLGMYRNDEADTLNRYYDSGLLEQVEDANGQQVQYHYDAASRVIREVVNPGQEEAVTEYQYSAKGQQIQQKQWLTEVNAINPDFILTTTDYDQAGQVTRITVEGDTDAGDVTTAFTYDDQGRQLTVSSGGEGGISYTTNDAGQLVREYNNPLHEVRYTYDALGRRTAETIDSDVRDSSDGNLLYRGLHLTTTYRYDDNNNVIQTINPNGATTTHYYDELNRNVMTVNALGSITENTYDLNGNMIVSRARAESIETYALTGGYNTDEVTDRLATPAHADDQVTQFIYNARNQLQFVIDAEGGVSESRYDSLGRVIESVQYDVQLFSGHTVLSVDNLASREQRVDFVSNAVGNRDVALTDRHSHTVYNDLGQAQYVIDALNQVSENTFDRGGRLLRTVEYAQTYEGVADFNNVNTWANSRRDNDSSNRHTWTVYNSLGQAELSIDGAGGVMQNHYDLAGRVIVQRSYRDAIPVQNYVSDGVLDQTAVLGWATESLQRWGTSIANQQQGVEYNTDILDSVRETQTQFDNAGRVVGITDALGEQEYFSYDEAGNRTSMINKLGHQWTYIYDAANRLVREESPPVEQSRVLGETWSQDFTQNTDGLTGTALTEPGVAHLDVTAGALTLNNYADGMEWGDTFELTTESYRPSHYEWQVEFSVGGRHWRRDNFIGIQGVDADGQPRKIGLKMGTGVTEGGKLFSFPTVEYQSTGETSSVSTAALNIEEGQAFGSEGLALDKHYILRFSTEGEELCLKLYETAADTDVLVGSFVVEGNWDDWGTNTARAALVVSHGMVDDSFYESSVSIHRIQQTVKGDGWAEWASDNGTQTILAPIYTDYKYDANGNQIQLIEASGTDEERVTDFAFDRLGRQVITWHSNVGVYHEAYDTNTTVQYASSARQEITIRPTERTWHDALGNEVAHRNQLGDYSFKVYDDANRLTYDIDAEGYVTGYTYNALGNQTELTRYAQQIKLPTGEELGRSYDLVELDVIEPLLTDSGLFAVLEGESVFALAPHDDRFGVSYERFDRWLMSEPAMVSRSDTSEQNRTINTTYNALGQRNTVTEAAVFSVHDTVDGLVGTIQQKETHFAYNRWGEVVDEWTLSGDDSEVHQYIFYDNAGRRIAVVDAENYLTTFAYDADDRLLESTEYALALADGWQMLVTLDAIKANALTAQTASADTVDGAPLAGFDRTMAYRYDALGRQTHELYRDVIVDTQAIEEYEDAQGQKRDVTYARQYQSEVLQGAMQYDAVGNLVRNIDATGAATISYFDALGRVTAVIEPTRLSEVFDTSERLSLVHIDKGTDTARLEWNTPAIAGATAHIALRVVDGEGDWLAPVVVSDGYTSTVHVSSLDTDRYEYKVTYQRDGETTAYGAAVGEVDIITAHQRAVTNTVSWVEVEGDNAAFHVNGIPVGAMVTLNGHVVTTYDLTENTGERIYHFTDLVRGQHTVDITEGSTVLSQQNFQVLISANTSTDFAIVNSTFEATVDIKGRQRYNYIDKEWHGKNYLVVDYPDLDQLGDGEVTWSIDLEFYDARGNKSTKTYTSAGPNHSPGGDGYISITSNQQRLVFRSETDDDSSSKGRSVILTRVAGLRLYKDMGGDTPVKVIDSVGNGRVERVEFLNVPASADAAEFRYRPTGSDSAQEYRSVTLTKGVDGYFYTGANQFPRGQYDYELYVKSDGNEAFTQYREGVIDLRDSIASQSEIEGGGSVAISPVTTYAYDAHGNRVEQTRHAAGAQGGFTDTDYSIETLDNDQTSYWRYDSAGNVRQAQNAEKESQYYSYDAVGRLRKEWQRVSFDNVSGINGATSQVHGTVTGYDKVGQITGEILLRPSLTTPEDANLKHTLTEYRFNGFGEVVAKGLDEGDGLLQEYFDYDQAGRLIRTNQDSGIGRVYLYDRDGRMRSEIATNGTEGFNLGGEQYNSLALAISAIDTTKKTLADVLSLDRAKVNRSDFTLDTLGRVIGKRSGELYQNDADEALVQAQLLDRWGNVIQVVDGKFSEIQRNRTEYRYNYLGKLVTEQQAVTSGIESWQQADKASQSVDTATYSVEQSVVALITEHFYDAQGRKVGSTDANGESEGLLMNAGGSATREMGGDGRVKSVGYDVFGNMRESKNANGAVSYMVYDGNNRMVKNFQPTGGEIQYDYNEKGQRIETRRLYNQSVDQQSGVVHKDWVTTKETYDALGNVVYSDVGGIKSGMSYDRYGRKNVEWRGNTSNLPLYSQTWEQNYFGRYVGANNVDLGGRGFTYTYNDANQVLTQTADIAIVGASGIQNLEYQYYSNGLLKTVTDHAMKVSTTYQYDEHGNKTQEKVTYTGYDNGNHDATLMNRGVSMSNGDVLISHVDGFTEGDYYIDSDGKLRVEKNNLTLSVNGLSLASQVVISIIDGQISLSSVFPINTDNLQLNHGIWGTLTTNTEYDDAGRIISVTSQSTGSLSDTISDRNYALDLTYYYDAVGNRRAVIDNNSAEAGENDLWYGYDEANRLILSQGTANVVGTLADITIADTPKGVLISYDAVGNRTETVRRVKGSESQIKTVTERFHYNANNLHTMTTLAGDDDSAGNAIIQKRYDLAGRVEYQLNYSFREDDYTGADTSASSVTRFYYIGGSDLSSGQSTYLTNGLTTLDGETVEHGELQSRVYSRQYDTDGTLRKQSTEDNTYRFSYVLGRDVILRQEAVDDQISSTEAGEVTYHYDANGQQISIKNKHDTSTNRSLVLNNQGQIVRKHLDGEVQNYYYQDNRGVATTGQIDDHDFDYNFVPLNDQVGLSSPRNYTVSSDSQSLGDVAVAIWGDASLWYLIADANGMSAGQSLSAGQVLIIPNQTVAAENTSEVFKPYNPSDIVGDISPTLGAPAAPLAQCSRGQMYVQILAIVIAIIIIYASGGTASDWAMALIYAASNLVAQHIGKEVGWIEEIDYTAVAVAAISGYFAGGNAGAASTTTTAEAASSSFLSYAAQGATQVVVDYGVRKALGEDVKFSWTKVITGAIVSGVSGANGWNAGPGAKVGTTVFSSIAKGYASHAINEALGGKKTEFDWMSVALNSFGQAVAGKVASNAGIKVDVSGAAGRTDSLVSLAMGQVSPYVQKAVGYVEASVGAWWNSAEKGVSTNGKPSVASNVSDEGTYSYPSGRGDDRVTYTDTTPASPAHTGFQKRSSLFSGLEGTLNDANAFSNSMQGVFGSNDPLNYSYDFESSFSDTVRETEIYFASEPIDKGFFGNIGDAWNSFISRPVMPLFSGGVNTQTDLANSFGAVDTGNVFANTILAMGASIPNAANRLVNEASLALAAPGMAWGEVRGLSLNQAETDILGMTASVHPMAGMSAFAYTGMRSGLVAGARKLTGYAPSNAGEMLTVYRGTGRYAENSIFDETGHLLSDAGQRSYLETGDLNSAYKSSQSTHDEWIDIWDTEADFIQAHGEFGDELKQAFGLDKSFLSVTTDLDVARYFSNGGSLYKAEIPKSQLIQQTLETSTESEWLLKNGSDLFELYAP